MFFEGVYSLLTVIGQGDLETCTHENLHGYLLVDFIVFRQKNPCAPDFLQNVFVSLLDGPAARFSVYFFTENLHDGVEHQ